MKEVTLVYAHGWAIDDWFWEPLQSELDAWPWLNWSCGYFGKAGPNTETELPAIEGPWVGIGHSLGFRKLVDLDLSLCRGLVSISGFLDFCGPGGTSPRIIHRMLRQFDRAPYEVLEAFYRNCGFEMPVPSVRNSVKLKDDLRCLIDEPQWGAEKKESCNGIQVFAIAGEQDKIVPRQLTQNQFANPIFHPAAEHSLGFVHSDWCAVQIRQFLSSHENDCSAI